MPRLPRLIAALAGGAALVGCASPLGDAFDTRENVGPCPPAGSIYDSARIVILDDGQSYSDIEYTGEITGVRLYCRYAGADPIEAELEIDFAFGRGPSGEAARHTYPYFVAVTRRNGTVLAKEYFSVTGEFSGEPVDAAQEVIRNITIPRADETISGSNFEVLVGFELTEAQLDFNRRGLRFRLDAQGS